MFVRICTSLFGNLLRKRLSQLLSDYFSPVALTVHTAFNFICLSNGCFISFFETLKFVNSRQKYNFTYPTPLTFLQYPTPVHYRAFDQFSQIIHTHIQCLITRPFYNHSLYLLVLNFKLLTVLKLIQPSSSEKLLKAVIILQTFPLAIRMGEIYRYNVSTPEYQEFPVSLLDHIFWQLVTGTDSTRNKGT